MKAQWMGIAAAAALLFAGQASAAVDETAAQALAKKNGCFNCHSLNKKLVGPSWKDVAKKYAADASAEAKLIDKIKKGGSGSWGAVPMPAQSPAVKDADIKTLVEYLLSLK